MQRLKLLKVTAEDKSLVLDYKNDFIASGDNMDGTAGLGDYQSFESWLEELVINGSEETVRAGLVPSTTYLALTLKDNQLVGMLSIRHSLNDYLTQHGGHIGYSVKKSERRNGYATEMLALALVECPKLGIEKVLLTCDKENTGSARTILNNGGVLENELIEAGRTTQRYWITVEKKAGWFKRTYGT